MHNQVYIAKLPFHTTKEDLFAFFSNYGLVVADIKIKRYYGKSGYAFVKFMYFPHYQFAINLSGTYFNGRCIVIKDAKYGIKDEDNHKSEIHFNFNTNVPFLINELNLTEVVTQCTGIIPDDIDIRHLNIDNKNTVGYGFITINNIDNLIYLINNYELLNYKMGNITIYCKLSISQCYLNSIKKEVVEEVKENNYYDIIMGTK